MMKEIKRLIAALEESGLEVSITNGKHHVRVFNPLTKRIVFFGAQSLGDRRARKNIKRDLKLVGYEGEIYS
jgi:hypothetical protein